MPRRNPVTEPDELAEEPRSRADERRAERGLEENLANLARELLALGSAQLTRLELPESVLDTVLDAQRMKTPAALNRQLRQVRAALRGADWSLVRARLDAMLRHGTIPAELDSADSPAARAHEWVTRLLGEGRSAIEALIELKPSADRTHLNTLLRQARKAAAGQRGRAQQRLADAVESLLSSR